jgi:uncharacterized membrane protein
MKTAIVVTAVACGVMGGVFFAFSSFVFPALERVPDATGVAAMNSINDRAETPVFLTVFLGTALACAALAVWSLLNWSDRRAPLVLAGSAVYVVGNFIVTMAANVPKNNRLMDHPEYWHDYTTSWAAWNHVRTVTGIVAAALLVAAALRDDA